MQVANGLTTDKGSHNKWFDCVAEYCDSQMDGHQSHDLWNTIDVYHVNTKDLALGFMREQSDLPGENNIGAKLNGNSFIEIEAY
jgi:hypothetical protein